MKGGQLPLQPNEPMHVQALHRAQQVSSRYSNHHSFVKL